MGIGVVDVGAGADGDQHVLPILGEDHVARPVAAAGELGVAGNVRNDGLGRAGRVQVTGVVRETLHGGGVADIDVLRIVSGIEGDAEGVVEAGGEGGDLGCLAIGADATEDDDFAGAGVGEEEIAIGRGHDEARLGEGSTAAAHVLGCSARCSGVVSPPA